MIELESAAKKGAPTYIEPTSLLANSTMTGRKAEQAFPQSNLFSSKGIVKGSFLVSQPTIVFVSEELISTQAASIERPPFSGGVPVIDYHI